MLTKLSIRNFKRLKDTGDIPLDNSVVFIGPNNSGKTTALQALSLWNIGLSKWIEKRVGKSKAKERTGVLINRKDIFAIPTPNARYLWNDLFVRESVRDKAGKVIGPQNITIEITVEGINNGTVWSCGLEFEYRDEDGLYCRPIEINNNAVIINPEILKAIRIAYLPPMSGLIPGEDKILPQTIAARIGEGRTAEVLRNLCYQVLNPEISIDGNLTNSTENWKFIVDTIRKIFGVNLNEPFLNERGGIEITYKDTSGNLLDLSSSGRGLQQVLLLIAYMMNNPRAVLLLDEPDAHLEILRQQQIYNLLTDLARERGSQIIAASHSEIVLRESAEKDIVIAFIGNKPHRVNDKGTQLMKSLTTIGFEDYYQAELKKWILYLEGSTDFSILKSFAKILEHKVSDYLETPFVHYVSTNRPQLVRDHFHGLKEAVSNLKGIAIFDRIENPLQSTALEETMWKRYEIENYLFLPEILIKYAEGKKAIDLFSIAEQEQGKRTMEKVIKKIVPQIAMENSEDEYWKDQKASEQLDRIFKEYFKELGKPNLMNKNKFFELAYMMDKQQINKEVIEKLDLIYKVISSIKNP